MSAETNKEKVLAHLISLSEIISTAPRITNRYGDWVQVTVGIGNDETAYITMTLDGFELLCARNEINCEIEGQP